MVTLCFTTHGMVFIPLFFALEYFMWWELNCTNSNLGFHGSVAISSLTIFTLRAPNH
jgi:hypothetical protein